MGERGKGAKPRRVLTEAETKQRARKRPWERKGLSRADRVVRFIQSLKITSGKFAGTPFRLRSWQKDFLRKVYAVDSNGHRLIRTAVLSMGRKNGKTQLAAAIALCHLVGPECEPRSEVYSCANDTEQAGKLFDEMWAMIRSDERLDDETNVISFRKEIKHYPTDGLYRAVSADDKTKLGLNPSCVIYDELGAAKNRKLFDAFDTAMGGREEPLFLVISTQAESDFAPMSELVDYGEQVAAGVVADPTFSLTLYAAPLDVDPFSPEAWRAANPALGDFRSLADVQRQAGQAQLMRSKRPAFENLVLNRRTAAEQRFVNLVEWKDNGDDPAALKDLEGKPCFLALDLSATRDLTGVVGIWGDAATGFDVHAWGFLPGEGLADRGISDRVPYVEWRDRDLIIAPPGTIINDPAIVAEFLAGLFDRFKVRGLAYDRFKMTAILAEFDKLGVAVSRVKNPQDDDAFAACERSGAVPIVDWGQGFVSMAPAVDALENAIAMRRLRHGNTPVLTWNAANAVTTKDSAGNRKLDKDKSRQRIDLIVCLAMALGLEKARSLTVKPPPDISAFLANPVWV
ncbi:terminase large subunit [Methylobacterium sp. HMF5984]|uniref:terminase large subunit n=1 Tax=Methylobacterium sp. HMF5984 TaxID=3367370 RepID=UPI003851EFD2